MDTSQFVYIVDADIFVRKGSLLYNVFSIGKGYDPVKNILVTGYKSTVEMDSKLWNSLYSFGAKCHDLWTKVVLSCHPSLLNSLTRVNKFTKNVIYRQYPLQEWLDFEIREFLCYFSSLNVQILQNLHQQDQRLILKKATLDDIRTSMLNWYRNKFPYHNKRIQHELLVYTATHLIPMPFSFRQRLIDSGRLKIRPREMLAISSTSFGFRDNKIFYSGGGYGCCKVLIPPKKSIIYDLLRERDSGIFYLKSQLQENGIPVYLRLPAYLSFYNDAIDVTKFFPKALDTDFSSKMNL